MRRPIDERLSEKLEKPWGEDGHWVWVGPLDKKKRPVLSIGKRWHRVVRLLYERFVGPLAEDQHLSRRCAHSLCVNPRHHVPYAFDAEAERFWSKVDARGDDECWPWTGAHFQTGHGQYWLRGGTVYAQRAVYEHEFGPLPRGVQVRRTCATLDCCNPRHLTVATRLTSDRDRYQKTAYHRRKQQRRSVVTLEQLLAVKRSTGDDEEVARQCGVSATVVRRLRGSKGWNRRPIEGNFDEHGNILPPSPL